MVILETLFLSSPYNSENINNHIKLNGMKRAKIKQQIEDGSWSYNDNDPYVVEFWENAVKLFPNEVAKDIQSLREFVKNDEEPFRMDDFIFNKEYGRILAPLNLDIVIEDI